MSVVVVKYRLRNAHVLSVDEFNENFYALASEIDGKLNEHNFQYGAFDRSTDLAPDASYSWSSTGHLCDPFFDWDSPGHQYQSERIYSRLKEVAEEWGANSTGTPAEFTQTGRWLPVNDMVQTITMKTSGWLWIIASFQHDHDSDNPGDSPGTAVGSAKVLHVNFGGANYGIRLNGQLLEESVLGGLDWANDPLRVAFPTSIGAHHAVISSAGILWPATPLVCDALVEVPPGRHQVELVLYTHPARAEKFMWVSNRELITLKIGN